MRNVVLTNMLLAASLLGATACVDEADEQSSDSPDGLVSDGVDGAKLTDTTDAVAPDTADAVAPDAEHVQTSALGVNTSENDVSDPSVIVKDGRWGGHWDGRRWGDCGRDGCRWGNCGWHHHHYRW